MVWIETRKLLKRVLLECGNDIKRLQELCVGPAEATGVETSSVEELGTTAEMGISVSVQNPPVSENLPVDGAEWVGLFVREMLSATVHLNCWRFLANPIDAAIIRSSCELER
ncbi:hypothetical protein V6N13_144316 [Hibiscus sabdariffa]